jgi:hypothetical protein
MRALTLIKISSLVLLLLGAALFLNQNFYHAVLIESIESKTIDGSSVYNKIWLETEEEKDIWWMRQSHQGVNTAHKNWDKLKIVVDKSITPYQVSFHQYKNGKETEYRASCFLCHSNGPRSIRPNWDSQSAPLSISEKLKIVFYNFKIKSYGPVHTVNKERRAIPLKFNEPFETEKLTVQTCLKCHNSDGIFARGPLLRQHSETIRHLVSRGEMPPWPYKLSKKEKVEIERFLNGL